MSVKFRVTAPLGAASLSLLILAAPVASAQDAAKPGPVPDFTTCQKPVWPAASLRKDEEGTVTLEFRIDADGKVGESRVLKSSGFELLDHAARDAIAKCRFKWSAPDAKPAATWQKMQYVWKLETKPAVLAEKWRLATANAESGNAKAQYELAVLYGESGPRHNLAETLRWMRSAADQGYADAQTGLGLMLQTGRGGPVDLAEAAVNYRKAADQGNVRAQHLLAMMTLEGRAVKRDRAAAMVLLRKASAKDYVPAQSLLGNVLIEEPGPELVAEGIALLRKAADHQDVRAQTVLGRCYEHGRGVAQDYVQAAALYSKAALAGHKQARLALASLYERGQGVPADPAKAKALREQAG